MQPSSTQGSITSSGGYSYRYRILEDDGPLSRSATNRGEYGVTNKRNVILESDDGSSDEGIVLHKKLEPIHPEPQTHKRSIGHESRTERMRSPKSSTRTGISSNGASERAAAPDTYSHASSHFRDGSETSPTSIINLNDYEAVRASQATKPASTRSAVPRALQPSVPKTTHVKPQARSVHGKIASSVAQKSHVYHSHVETEPNFDDFSDTHFSEVTITGTKNADAIPSPAILKGQPAKSSTPIPPVASSFTLPAPLPKTGNAAAGANGNPSKQKHPQRNRSFDSISSINSDDMMHLTTARPPLVPLKSKKVLRTSPGKHNPAPADPEVNGKAIDSRSSETSKGGPHASGAPPREVTLRTYHSSPSPPSSMASQQYSRKSADHASPNPDFWRELEEMLSDSDTSVVFPPDILKHKARDANLGPAAEEVNRSRNGTDDGELKRPMTAPSARTSSLDAMTKNGSLAGGQSRAAATTRSANFGESRDNCRPTAAPLMDTSGQKKGKKGFLTKLRKKAINDKNV